jgi:mannose-6-phosphate isomerase-like protein (cupin superfamily)
MFHFLMVKRSSRRAFLQTAPLAAAAGLALTDASVSAQTPAPQPFKLIPASQLAEALAGLKQKPGNYSFYDNPAMPFTAVLTVEEKHAATEFEWHEGRDHLFQVVDGTTVYEIGGTPQNGRNTKPAEWLAPASAGATKMTLHKGDWLIIPRGTPHKRTTEGSVTFFLISTTGK